MPGFGRRSPMLDRQLDPESCASARRGFHRDFSAVIAYDRLHNRKTEARAMLLARVIRRKQARALFRRQANAGIADFDAHRSIVLRSSYGECSSGGHGVKRIEHEIF